MDLWYALTSEHGVVPVLIGAGLLVLLIYSIFFSGKGKGGSNGGSRSNSSTTSTTSSSSYTPPTSGPSQGV